MKLVQIIGPSCAGKTTLSRHLQDYYGYTKVQSVTTRLPRADDEEGDYDYTNRYLFAQIAARGGFIEHEYFKTEGYGTLRRALDGVEDKVKVLRPDGIIRLTQAAIDANHAPMLVYLAAPLATLRKRIHERDGSASHRFATLVAEVRECEAGVQRLVRNDPSKSTQVLMLTSTDSTEQLAAEIAGADRNEAVQH